MTKPWWTLRSIILDVIDRIWRPTVRVPEGAKPFKHVVGAVGAKKREAAYGSEKEGKR